MEIKGLNYARKTFGGKISNEILPLKGMVTVTYEYNQPLGARSNYAKVKIFASIADDFYFKSEVNWAKFVSSNYSQKLNYAILDGILETLINKVPRPILKGNFILQEVGWDEVNSCENSFHQASIVATIGVLRATGYSDLF